MSPRQINSSVSLASLREETFYTQVRITADPASADLAPLVEEECTRVKAAISREEALGDAELQAQAIVDYWQGIVEQDIEMLAIDLSRLVCGDRSDPRFLRLFRKFPSEISRAGLDSQMAVVQEWPAFLATEATLSSWSGVFANHLVNGRNAITTRDQAAMARRDWRAREREEVFETANAFRKDLHSTICLRIREKGKVRTWPDGFFRKGHTVTSSRAEVQPTQSVPV